MSHVIITGAAGGIQPGAVAPNRMEINDFVKQTELFSLYIQALSELHFVLCMSPNKVHLFSIRCHVQNPTEQINLSLWYWGHTRPSLYSVGGVWWLPTRTRNSVAWVLHSRLRALPDLAQTLCGSL